MVEYLNNNAKLKFSLSVQMENKSVCCSIWFGGFLSLGSFYILFFIIFNLVVILHVWTSTFGVRLKWGQLNKTLIFDHFFVGSTSHLQNPLLQTIRALASTFKTHNKDPFK